MQSPLNTGACLTNLGGPGAGPRQHGRKGIKKSGIFDQSYCGQLTPSLIPSPSPPQSRGRRELESPLNRELLKYRSPPCPMDFHHARLHSVPSARCPSCRFPPAGVPSCTVPPLPCARRSASPCRLRVGQRVTLAGVILDPYPCKQRLLSNMTCPLNKYSQRITQPRSQGAFAGHALRHGHVG